MCGKSVLLIVAMAVGVALAVPSRRSAVINGVVYFTNTEVARNRNQALSYCISQGGELATVNGTNYRVLQAVVPTVGDYFIDGIDKVSADRFLLDQHCSMGNRKADFAGIPYQNLDIRAVSCLSYYKGATTALSKVRTVDCSTQLAGVLCSYPTSGCID